jgi:AcrR family transcriptional regulator
MPYDNKKYKDILTTAKELFWKHGFKRVSVEEICQKAQVSKMTFYKYIPNKIELARTIYDKVLKETELRFKKIMNGDSPPDEKIRQIMLMKFEGTTNISPEFMEDFYAGKEPELKTFVERRTQQAWDMLNQDIRKAQKAGIFRKDFKPELLNKIQYKLVSLLEDESVTGMFDSPQELLMELVNIIIYGIIPHD